jgi:hypothetical protein
VEERPEERGADQPAAEGHGEAPEATEDTSAAWEGGSGWINTEVAAAALDVSPRTVRDYIAAGKLVARTEGSGVQRRHMVDLGSLQALLDDRRRGRPTSPPRGRREERASVEAAIEAAGSADASAARTIRELVARLEARSAEAADARARLELAERTQSALRGELEGEREERRRMGEEAGRLREELEAERSKGFWRRLFGG